LRGLRHVFFSHSCQIIKKRWTDNKRGPPRLMISEGQMLCHIPCAWHIDNQYTFEQESTTTSAFIKGEQCNRTKVFIQFVEVLAEHTNFSVLWLLINNWKSRVRVALLFVIILEFFRKNRFFRNFCKVPEKWNLLHLL